MLSESFTAFLCENGSLGTSDSRFAKPLLERSVDPVFVRLLIRGRL